MNSKCWPLLVLLLLLPALDMARSKAGSLDAGIEVGSLTGVDAKYWIDEKQALELSVGGAWPGAIVGQASYLWHVYGIFHGQGNELARDLPLYFGVGAHFDSANAWPYGGTSSSGALRTVSGANYIFPNQPFDVFLEIAPMIYLYPGSTAVMQAEAGGRYRF